MHRHLWTGHSKVGGSIRFYSRIESTYAGTPIHDQCLTGLFEAKQIGGTHSVVEAPTFRKAERIAGRTLVERLFNGTDSRAMSAFPIRLVFLSIPRDEGEPRAKILVSVPKRYFKRAVKRNRVKRQIREAYRKHKQLIPDDSKYQMLMAFIWMDSRLYDTSEVERRITNLLQRMIERL